MQPRESISCAWVRLFGRHLGLWPASKQSVLFHSIIGQSTDVRNNLLFSIFFGTMSIRHPIPHLVQQFISPDFDLFCPVPTLYWLIHSNSTWLHRVLFFLTTSNTKKKKKIQSERSDQYRRGQHYFATAGCDIHRSPGSEKHIVSFSLYYTTGTDRLYIIYISCHRFVTTWKVSRASRGDLEIRSFFFFILSLGFFPPLVLFFLGY